MMKHGSLFSGIGGFDLASEWMGWENVFHCEWNEFGKKVLHHYWPNAESFDDITKTDFTKYANKIDILTGGFPCQPYSMAGKRQGKEDERHLWPQMLRAIREIKPKYIVGENVFGLLNWNGGMVFDEVHSDLEFEGYEVQAVVIPAAAVNAPHGRDRVWFVATNTKNCGCGGRMCERCSNGKRELFSDEQRGREMGSEIEGCGGIKIATDTNGNGFNQCNGNNEINPGEGRFDAQRNANTGNVNGDVTDTDSGGLEGAKKVGWDSIDVERESKFGITTDTKDIGRKDALENGELEGGRFRFGNKPPAWDSFPSQSPICGGDDGLPTELDNITFSKWRNESIKAYGNAIVPQVAYEIFKAIERTI